MTRVLQRAIVPLLLSLSLGAQATHVVGATGSFATIEAAFDAASAGDTILIQPGLYNGFSRFPGKGVRILGDGPGVVVSSTIEINSVPATEQLVLAGFEINAQLNPTYPSAQSVALWIWDCPNLVVSDMVLTGPHGTGDDGGSGLAITSGSSGVVSGVTANGGNGTPTSVGQPGGPGCWISESHIAFSGCDFHAGDSGTGSFGSSQTRWALMCLGSSLAAIDECALRPGSPLGHSLLLHTSHGSVADHTGLISGTMQTTTQPAILEYQGGAGAIGNTIVREQPSLAGPNTVARGGVIQWTARGGQGYQAVSMISLGTKPLLLPSLFPRTALFTAIHPTSVVFDLVTIGNTGETTLSLAVPNIPALKNEMVFLQLGGWLHQSNWRAGGVPVTRIL
jgi:hypothetical protein